MSRELSLLETRAKPRGKNDDGGVAVLGEPSNSTPIL